MKPFYKYTRLLAVASAFALATGCATHSPVSDASFDADEINAQIIYCSDSSYDLASQANTPALHKDLADHALMCIDTIDSNILLSSNERLDLMHVHGLAITSLIKAGDLASAQYALEDFKTDHDGKDLRLANGASFIQTMDLLLSNVEAHAARKGSLLNAHEPVKSEIRRAQYWVNN